MSIENGCRDFAAQERIRELEAEVEAAKAAYGKLFTENCANLGVADDLRSKLGVAREGLSQILRSHGRTLPIGKECPCSTCVPAREALRRLEEGM